MKLPRAHAVVLSLTLGGALATGGYALTRTAGVEASGAVPAPAAATKTISQAALAAKDRELDALER
ncbi:MAG: hypothetical protein AB1416_09505, partial [Actinomycetota bacterium]